VFGSSSHREPARHIFASEYTRRNTPTWHACEAPRTHQSALDRGQGAPLSLTFAQLGVPQNIVAALDRRGITNPFEIQEATLVDALEGRDVCGRAPTGSGKTLAFGIPLVAKVSRATPRRPHALVLAPTRELAEQITVEMRTFSGPTRISAVYGGVGYGAQYNALRQGVDILVACPGRLEDLIAQKAVNLADVNFVVVDEADRMADMGFMPAVRRLLDQTSEDRQTMLYSATLDGDVAKLTRDYQKDAVRHEVGEETPDITSASNIFWKVNRGNRNELVAEAINASWPAIVFCRTRHGSDRLAKDLEAAGIKAGAIHGGRSQNQRMRALAEFSKGKVQALVASDVAARGIHVDNVAMVVHFDPPDDHKTYVHRSGRTARAGQGGVVLSLVLPEQARESRRMMRMVGIDEQFISPDSAALRELAPVPAYKKAPSPAPSEPIVDDRSELEPWSERDGGRPNAADRLRSSGAREQGGSRSYGNNDRRPAYNERRGPTYDADRGERSERPAYDPSKRFASGPAKRPFQSGRPSQGDRANQGPRPFEGDRPSQGSRPFQGDRPSQGSRPFQGDRPSQGSRPFQGDRPYQGSRPFQGDRPSQGSRPADSGRGSAVAPRRPRANDDRQGGQSGAKPWESRKPNQVGRSSAPERKDFSDRPFASGPATRKIGRSARTRTKASK
jgi:superfamily II DNA/RNA helicase